MNENVYEPSDDTELLYDLVDSEPGESALEIGSGTGVISIKLAKKGARVIAVDINPWAALATKLSAELNDVDVDVINCDVASCLRDVKFDLAVFNPPYLPVDEVRSWIDYAWAGGRSGIDVLLRFFDMVRAFRYYVVYSSLSDFDSLMTYFNSRRFEIRKVASKTVGFETIYAVEVKPHDKGGTGRT
ncbi:MAG: HemK2/MTQ2 family protein methyltransferase [Thermoprotei archaeon]